VPVTEQDYAKWADEVSGGDAAVREQLMKFSADQSFRDRSAGSHMLHRDYSQKTQLLAADRKELEKKAAEYEQALQDAEGKLAKVMDDLANSRISEANAKAQVSAIKERWQLKDDDVPTDREVQLTSRIGKDVTKGSSIDIDAKLNAFKADLLKELTPAFNRMTTDAAAMDVVWDEISNEHRDLFGSA